MGLLVDNFAGGGGASLGIQLATGRSLDIAINHDRDAIAMHEANHPDCKHFCEDVWSVDPVQACGGREVDLAWFSPDCKHFSRAKGGKPAEKKIRGLAWIAIKWARLVRPKLIILENVREFETWGPLNEDNMPCPKRRGITFRRFVGTLRNLGYEVQWRELNAADYGAPTHRRRLFLIARCDGEPIVWPEATHGPGRAAWRTAAECIDWSLPCPSIFTRKRPLREKTLQRIARGLKRFVLDAAEPFIVLCNHGDKGFRGQSVNEPLRTVTGSRDARGVVMPYVTRICQNGGNGANVQRIDEPLRTIVSKNEHLLCTPYLIPRYGERKGQKARSRSVKQPMPAVVPTANGGTLCAAFLAKHFGGVTGCPVKRPLPTITARGTQTQIVAAFISNQNRADKGSDMREPLRTVCSNNHAAEVRAFLIKYYGTNVGQDVRDPLQTITTKHRFGLVTIAGIDYQIVDIGMRMLTPRELARAQGFPDSYLLTGTKTNQVMRIGNSVCPPVAAAVVGANYRPAVQRATA